MSGSKQSGAVVDVTALQHIVEQGKRRPGALLPLLHEIQAYYRYIPSIAIDMLADALNLSKAEVHGVVSFYHDFRTEPESRLVVKLCRAEACQSVGSEALYAEVQNWLAAAELRDQVVIEPVYCLGNCACGPSAQMAGEGLLAYTTLAAVQKSVTEQLAEPAV